MRMTVHIVGGLVLVAVIGLAGCGRPFYDASRATRSYPEHLHTTNVVNMHVLIEGSHLTIVNSTATSYSNFDMWINQRYVHHIESLRAGETLRVPMGLFYDERGDAVRSGGFLRTVEATAVRLVEIQTGPDEPMIGLVTIPEGQDAPSR